ncbi:hypothetical protein SAM23877_2531 [Streptomyces ambofaciens ATCC 23877]|uniref:Uncharacterized protein n=1 Tax=Streptomyces ambofaciens (strain ATCC 23877 / 3486 / DSM 40053 / JCM 4204 / NBRC 12836 / NRRL B-2516) TaxID=278992 RepID=A0A0K2AR47_STRA7|nr:hypothetical protein SAM23877_2531 [Streptomyces ambofaciens ATCC 23877]
MNGCHPRARTTRAGRRFGRSPVGGRGAAEKIPKGAGRACERVTGASERVRRPRLTSSILEVSGCRP